MREFYRGMEVVRVKDDASRDEYTIQKRFVVDGLTVLNKPALASNGKPAPPKEHTPLGTPAPGSKQARRRTAKKASPASRRGVDAGQTSAAKKEK